MILGRILEFLKAQQFAGLREIASAVGSSPDAVRSMLETLERKGLVQRYQPSTGCGTSCKQCTHGEVEYFCLADATSNSVTTVSCSLIQSRS